MAVLSLNIFSAFFTPTFTTTIPLITSSEERSAAMSLSNATYQLLGVIGPGIAGGLAAWIGTKEIFFVDALTFLIAAIMIATLNDFMDSCWNRQTLVNLPTQTLIADCISSEIQGRVYGAHFAWSHLWWVMSYPLAGWMSSHFVNSYFFYSSLAGIVLIFCVYLIFKPEKYLKLESGQWHENPLSQN